MVAKAKGRPVKHRTSSSAAPVGGLNVRDGLNVMPQTDALNLVNWIPQQYGVRSRKGWIRDSINAGKPVYSMMTYQPFRADSELFAVTDDAILNVTVGTDAPGSVLALTGNARYGYFTDTMFANTAGSFLAACSHEGGYFTYDGVTWTKRVAGASAGQINGVDPDLLCFVTNWKRRLWFVRKQSSIVYYLDTDSITGNITAFDVGPFMKNGGNIAFIANWTIDAGEGIDDFLIIAGENGDILIYKGTNPDSAATFGLVGVYYIGRLPPGRRCFTPYGGDLLILSERGIQPMSYVTRGGQSLLRASSIDYLAKIQPRISDLVGRFSNVLGWSMKVYPKENLMIITVPIDVTGIYDQYALYTNTNTWTILRGMPNNGSMTIVDSQLYFGTAAAEVVKAFSGFFDNVKYGETIGDGIQGTIQPAYSYFGMPGKNKQFLMVRPTFLSPTQPAFAAQMTVDYQYLPPVFPATFPPSGGGLWDIGDWDIAVWQGELNTFDEWKGVGAIGYSGSVVLDTICAGDTFLASIDYMYEPGGVL